MVSLEGYTQDEINKLGNSIVYLADNIANLSKTKLLKLIYLLDELSIKSSGVPFFNLRYKVWQAGPVNIDVYSELSSTPTILKDFVTLRFEATGECYINAKRTFDDGEFSDNELKLLSLIVSSYGNMTATKLVDLCHRPNTLWYQIAKEKGLLELFETGKLNTSDFEIELSDYIKDDKLKSSIYEEHKEFLNFSKRFKA